MAELTTVIQYTVNDVRDLTTMQQHMMAEIAENVNAALYISDLTVDQAVQVLWRLIHLLRGER